MKLHRKVRGALAIARKRGMGTLWNTVLTRYAQQRMPDRCPNQPVFAQIEITTHCNLRCAACLGVPGESGPSARKATNLSFDEFRRVMEGLPHVRWVCLNGIGEPLLNPELVNMIRYLSDAGIRVSFFTNATLLKGEIAERLVESGLDTLKFSIDAADPEVFGSIRRGASLEEVSRNIRDFATLVRDSGRPTPRLCVMTTVMKDNASEIPEIVELVHSLGVDELQLKRMIPWADALNASRVSKEELQSVNSARDTADRLHVNLNVGPLLRDQLDGKRTQPREAAGNCKWPWTGTYITVDGRVTPCCNLFDPDRAGIGNVFDEDFEDIWNGTRLKQLRSELKRTLPKICRTACSPYDLDG